MQVDIDETDPLRAKRLGEYQCNFLVAHSGDSARYNTRACRYWPELRHVKDDGSLGKQIEVAPNKAASFLTRNPATVQFSDRICLSENRIAGPFNFGRRSNSGNKSHGFLPDEAWEELGEVGPGRGFYVSNLNRIIR